MPSALVHRAVTALAVTLGAGALAASANGMRSIDSELVSVTKPVQQQEQVKPCPEPQNQVPDGEVRESLPGSENAREL
ncbi:hypothetical protein GKE82_17650 [Conexibacter sp. W3-3-2]|nr:MULTISPECIES: hypothetical protein [Solirubrobacterales]MTD46061.1 hypothetical protein [Conexibacter sp. W3-3-2]